MFRFLGARMICAASRMAAALVWAGSAYAVCIKITKISELESIGISAKMPLSGNYCLGKTIQANGATIAPIGTSTAPLTGTFDGKGYEISGLTISGTGIYVGLFAY
jgi:trimeric autotransporter adhesin